MRSEFSFPFAQVAILFKFVQGEVSVYRRQSGRCAYCNVKIPFKNGEIDHIVPLSRGGDDDCWNICFACVHCNRTKSSKFVVEFKHKEES